MKTLMAILQITLRTNTSGFHGFLSSYLIILTDSDSGYMYTVMRAWTILIFILKTKKMHKKCVVSLLNFMLCYYVLYNCMYNIYMYSIINVANVKNNDHMFEIFNSVFYIVMISQCSIIIPLRNQVIIVTIHVHVHCIRYYKFRSPITVYIMLIMCSKYHMVIDINNFCLCSIYNEYNLYLYVAYTQYYIHCEFYVLSIHVTCKFPWQLIFDIIYTNICINKMLCFHALQLFITNSPHTMLVFRSLYIIMSCILVYVDACRIIIYCIHMSIIIQLIHFSHVHTTNTFDINFRDNNTCLTTMIH